ncbi:MAG: deacetylase, partial [Clostridiaceae bacterium]|nr:deacetylase [Clostridiaceae bacterium]
EDIINEAIGIKTNLFRFPSGAFNESAVNIVEGLGYIPIHWSSDSVDWKNTSLDIEYNRVLKSIEQGGIMLFHNNGKYTAQNLDKLIPKLKSDGYNFVKVGELIYNNNYIIDENGIQRNK